MDRAAVKAERLEAKRVTQLRKKKSQQEERAEILAKLSHFAAGDDLKFLKSSAKLGQGQSTKKEALRRALEEEKAGVARSQPELALYEERDQVVDFTVPKPVSTHADDFIAEHSHLLKIKTKKKAKKSKTPAEANPTRNLKKKLFSVIESSDSDSEGHVKRKALQEKHAMDQFSSMESSVSDISSSEDQQTQSNLDSTKPSPTTDTSTSIPASSTSFVIPSFALSSRASKTSMSIADSMKRAMERKTSKTPSLSTDPDSTGEHLPSSTSSSKGFIIPNFSGRQSSAQHDKPVGKQAEDSEGEISSSSGVGSESSDESDVAGSLDEEDLEMRLKHGRTPAREHKDFSDALGADVPHISALNAPVPESQRGEKVVKTKYFVEVKRLPEIEAQRRDLPILMEEHQIMETISNNDFVIICGETGSGKTTQVPQFLYEAGYGDPKSPTPGLIGVTEPRRVAAISTSQRVATELNQIPPGLDSGSDSNIEGRKMGNITNSSIPPSNASASPSNQHGKTKMEPKTKQVAYQVRYDVTTDRNTRIKFMTDGILLREIQSDFLLKRYSVIIIDEVHERTMNTDLLLGLLCRIVPLRKELSLSGSNGITSPLKVVIMSATLRVSDFVENHRMFPTTKPPVIKIGARQFPVTIHFNRKTSLDNYILDAYKKVLKIHTKLPQGGILVFLSGQAEILKLVKMLRTRFDKTLDANSNYDLEEEYSKFDTQVDIPEEEKEDESDESEESLDSVSYGRGSESSESDSGSGDESEGYGSSSIDMDAVLKPKRMVNVGSKIESPASSSGSDSEVDPDSHKMDVDTTSTGDGDSKPKKKKRWKLDESERAHLNDDMRVVVMPLYSMLPPKEQMRIFGTQEERTRLIVVATNIAETSLTIPGITYVVDAGRVKSKVFDKSSGMTSYKVDWTSRASADQRAGRAGRTGPGHCYRLFSSAVYQRFPQFSIPDILNIPIEGVVLQMKQIGIERLDRFPFPTPPDATSLELAHTTLLNIGALEHALDDKEKKMKDMKITPLGRALVHFPVAPRYAKMLIIAQQSDCLRWIVAIVAALAVGDPFEHNLETRALDLRQGLWKAWSSNTSDLLVWLSSIGAFEYSKDKEHFCEQYKLHLKTMKEIHLLRHQLHRIIQSTFSTIEDKASEDVVDIKTLEEDLDAEEVSLQQKIRTLSEISRKSSEITSSSSRASHRTSGAQSSLTNKPVVVVSTATDFDGKFDKPSKEQNLKIRQIIASGLLDQVAKKYPQLDEHGAVMKNRFVYRTATSLKECTLHPNSFLKFDQPEYVCYNELIDTSEAFLCGVTAVSMGWMGELAPWLCGKMDVFLETPPPRFDATKDIVIGAVQPYYFHADWIVPKLMVPMQGVELYKHFAKCLLQGEICPSLKQFQPFLNANPEIILKVWTQQKIGAIVQPLMDKKIKTRKHLLSIWKEKDPTFLLSAFALWIDKSKHSALKAAWPPIGSQADVSLKK